MIKIFATILQRPMALLFFLTFLLGCAFLFFMARSTPPPIAYQEEGVYKEGGVVQDKENADTLNDAEFHELQEVDADEQSAQGVAVGGPAGEKEIIPVKQGDSGELKTKYTVLSEIVDSPSECTSLEAYDPILEVCYFGCDSKKQCNTLEKKVNAELDALDGAYTKYVNAFTEDEEDVDPQDVLARYIVEEEEWIEVEEGKGTDRYKEIWNTFASISPDQITNAYIGRYIVYRNTESDTAAFVQEISGAAPKWALYVNIDAIEESDKEENMFLLTHEFAHIMTLNSGQVDPQVDEAVCDGFFTGEGCALPESYIQKFFDEFWTQGDLIVALDYAENPDGTENPLYAKNPEAFINDYAATNPGEDIAESFASFIFKKKPTGGRKVSVESKINFFYTFPELVSLRQAVRQGLGVERIFETR